MMGAYLAASLVRARTDVNAVWPNRDRGSDGWIGDQAHQRQGSASDHNPDAKGCVHAIDVDSDGIDVGRLVAALCGWSPTRYVISNRRIYHVADGFAPRVYTGDDPHTGHVHESIEHTDGAENYSGRLDLGGGPLPPITPVGVVTATGYLVRLPQLARNPGVASAAVRQLQRASNLAAGARLAVDGRFGDATRGSVVNFQRAHRLVQDGVCGPRTWTALAQACLLARGANPGGVDGLWGPRTGGACRGFQQQRGLVADAICGPRTWAALLG